MDEPKSEVVCICRRCHRKLKTPEAIERGMGKICWEKSQQENKSGKLFDPIKLQQWLKEHEF